MTTGEKLKRLRESRGLSQDQVAGTLGIAKSNLSNWELGTHIPRLDVAVRLVDLYGVDLDYLARDEVDEPYRNRAGGRTSVLDAATRLRDVADEVVRELKGEKP